MTATPGFTGADLDYVCQQAAVLAVQDFAAAQEATSVNAEDRGANAEGRVADAVSAPLSAGIEGIEWYGALLVTNTVIVSAGIEGIEWYGALLATNTVIVCDARPATQFYHACLCASTTAA